MQEKSYIMQSAWMMYIMGGASFLKNYAENNALVMPGKTQGIQDHRMVFSLVGKQKKAFRAVLEVYKHKMYVK